MAGALAGLRVLDLTDQKGALAGKLLADLGADVVLVEPPGGGPLRGIPPFWQGLPDRERSLFFWFYGTSKRGITLDVARPPGAALLGRLAAEADVLLESEPPGRLAALGCGAEALRVGNPRLVIASITPFGQRGPYRDWRASDTVAEAMGGMLLVNGHRERPPLRALGLQAYHQAGIFAAVGVLGALFARDRTGRGQDLDVSLQAAVAGALEHVPGLWHQAGTVAARQGTLHWTRYFRVEWVKADGMAADLGDPAWEDVRHRAVGAEHLFDVLDAWAARYTVEELVEGAQLRRIPYAAVRPPEGLLRDPHLAERAFFVPIEHPELGATVPYPGPPFHLTDTPWRISRRPPRLAEHNHEVYGEVGITAAELAMLREQGIV